MRLLDKILFPTDLGEEANQVLEYVSTIAKRFNSEILLLHVFPEGFDNELVMNQVEERIKRFVLTIKNNHIKCSYEIATGDYARKAVEVAETYEVDLIALGAGSIEKGNNRLGSNSEKIIRNSTMPVWVIENDALPVIKTIVCPVDFSEESRIALDNANHLARRFDSNLVIVHVADDVENEYGALGIESKSEKSKILERNSKELEAFLKDVNLSGIDWKTDVLFGKPAEEIIELISSNQVDLVVLGSTGKTGLQRFFIGSVSEKITRRVPCSFLVSKSEYLVHLRLEKDLSNIDSLFNEGTQLADEGFTKEAITIWKRCVQLNEFYLKAWSAIALTYEDSGDAKKAKHYRKAIRRIQRSIWDKQVEADIRGKHSLYK